MRGLIYLITLWMTCVLDMACSDWCGNGSMGWIDNTHPNEYYVGYVITEPVPSGAELDQMCNRSLGGIIQIKCRDDKGEPFRMRQDSFLSGDKGLNLSCSDNGATCQILRVNSTCYEFAIWIDCICPPEPTTVSSSLKSVFSTKTTISSTFTTTHTLFTRPAATTTLSLTTKSPRTTVRRKTTNSNAMSISQKRTKDVFLVQSNGTETSTSLATAPSSLNHNDGCRIRNDSNQVEAHCVVQAVVVLHILLLFAVFILKIGVPVFGQ